MISLQTIISLGILVQFLVNLFSTVQNIQGLGHVDNAEPNHQRSPPIKKQLDDYYTSLVGVQYLARQEQLIVEKMVRYKQKLEETLQLIDIYLDDYTKSISPVLKKIPELREKAEDRKYPFFKDDNDLQLISEQMSGNPLMVFKLLRRYAIELDDISVDMEDGQHSELKEHISNLGKSMDFPTLTDLNGAADGLLRLQETYALPTVAMSNGMLVKTKTGCKLPAADMQFIGVRGINEKRFAIGADWLYGAYQKVLKGDESLPLPLVKAQLLVSRTLHNQEFLKFKKEHSNLFSNLINSNYTNIPELFIRPEIWERPIGQLIEGASIYDVPNFNALCRGEQLLSPEQTKDLRCWYSHKNSPFNVISPLKMELHHKNPMLVQIYDLISDKTINYIKNAALPSLRRSTVVGTTSVGLKSDIRTSSVAWLADYPARMNGQDNFLSRIPRIVKGASGLDCDSERSAEQLQVSCYGAVGGYYIPHYDSLIQKTAVHAPETGEDLRRGDRIATLMFYLTDVELGGGTAFPRLGVAAKAIKGSAVLWYNLKRNGGRDLLTMHGGCPVLYGNKWVANKWIRVYEQMHVRKCGKLLSD